MEKCSTRPSVRLDESEALTASRLRWVATEKTVAGSRACFGAQVHRSQGDLLPPLSARSPYDNDSPKDTEAAIDVSGALLLLHKSSESIERKLDQRLDRLEVLIRETIASHTVPKLGANQSIVESSPAERRVSSNESIGQPGLSSLDRARSSVSTLTSEVGSVQRFRLHAGWTTTGSLGQENFHGLKTSSGSCLETTLSPETRLISRNSRISRLTVQYPQVASTLSKAASILQRCTPKALVLNPGCSKRLFWDIWGMLFLFYDVVTIPMSLGFQPPETAFSEAMLLVTTTFWSMDILLTFFTGYFRRGILILSPCEIAMNYARTWLLMDVAVVGLDWVLILVALTGGGDDAEDASAARLGRTFRMFRILRTLRLLRLVKLRKIMDDIHDRISSQYLHIMSEMVKHVFIIVAINHIIACIWFNVGDSIGDEGWVATGGFLDAELNQQYLAAFHWSLTQMTPASMDVFPKGVPERTFAVVIVLFGIVVFSSFISSITASMSQVRSLNNETQQQFWMLRRFLKDQKISPELTARIKRYLEHKVQSSQKHLKDEDVKMLKQLSLPLQMDLAGEKYRPIFRSHPFFRFYMDLDLHAYTKLCSGAVSRISLSEGDDLFSVGTASDRVFYVMSGSLIYFHLVCAAEAARKEAPTGHEDCVARWKRLAVALAPKLGMYKLLEFIPQTVSHDVSAGSWICESALWVSWVHRGSLRVTSTICEILTLDAERFQAVTLKHHTVRPGTVRYAESYAHWVNDLVGSQVSDLNARDWLPERTAWARDAFNQSNGENGNDAPWRFSDIGKLGMKHVLSKAEWCDARSM